MSQSRVSKAILEGIAIVASSLCGHAAQAQYAAVYLAPQGPQGSATTSGVNTITQIVRLEAAGTTMRLVFDNELGTSPVTAQNITLTLYSADNKTSMTQNVTFPGTAYKLSLAAGQKHVVSNPITFPSGTGFRGQIGTITTFYSSQNQGVNYVDNSYGDKRSTPATDSATLSAATNNFSRGRKGAFQRLELIPSTAKEVLVAIGDSITAGYLATDRAHKSYPEQLTDRYNASNNGDNGLWSVVNAGIAGNRLLSVGNGPRLLDRLQRDALDVPCVRAVLLLEGINDIMADSSAADIEEGYVQAIRMAHGSSRNVRIYLGTILPFANNAGFTTAREQTRQTVNSWIRNNVGGADGIIEFALALYQPNSKPPALITSLSQPDHLHPNDAGYGVMANQVPLSTIDGNTTPGQCPAS